MNVWYLISASFALVALVASRLPNVAAILLILSITAMWYEVASSNVD